MKKRLFCLLLMLVLVLSQLSVSAHAEDGGLLQAGDVLYFGEYTDTVDFTGATLTSPVSWLVLDPQVMNTGDPGVFLLTQYVVQRSNVRYDSDFARWQGSYAQQWCADFLAAAFTDAERALIPAVDKQEESVSGYGLAWGTADLEQEQVFFLSTRECMQYVGPDDGYDGLSGYTVDGVPVYWWFRTPHMSHPDYAGLVLDGNQVHDHLVYAGWGARPAANLDLSRAILLIPAEGQPEVGKLAPVTRPADGSWKLIAADDRRSLTLTAAGVEDGVLHVSYAGASTGADDYISLLVRSPEGKDLFYGRLCQAKQASGDLTIDLDALNVPQGSSVCLFSEHESGDFHTNYASPLCLVSCSLSFDPGAGSGSMDSIQVPLDGDAILPECSFTAPAHQVFDHWELEGVPLDPGQPPRFLKDSVLTAVYTDVPITAIHPNPASLQLGMFQKGHIDVALQPEDAVESQLSWYSSSPLVLSVDDAGNLRGLLPGSALLTVSAADGVSARIPVYVSANPLILALLIGLPLLLLLLLLFRLIRWPRRR